MTALEERHHQLKLLAEARASGARQESACAVLGLSPRTVQRLRPVEPSAATGARCGSTNRPTR